MNLLEIEVNERSISHKIAEYLQALFLEWHVDCEYNRNGIETKKLPDISECSEDKKTDKVYPDIIVHRRLTMNNLLVIEIKTTHNDAGEKCDFEKLKLFTSSDGDYKYNFGLFIKFNVNEFDTTHWESAISEIKWYSEGREMSKEELLTKYG